VPEKDDLVLEVGEGMAVVSDEPESTLPDIVRPVQIDELVPKGQEPEKVGEGVVVVPVPDDLAEQEFVEDIIGAPGGVVPESTVPEGNVPESTVPENTVPENTVPESTVPEGNVPERRVPEGSMPERGAPEANLLPPSSQPPPNIPSSQPPPTVQLVPPTPNTSQEVTSTTLLQVPVSIPPIETRRSRSRSQSRGPQDTQLQRRSPRLVSPAPGSKRRPSDPLDEPAVKKLKQ
jgi:hypothetical protein